MAVVTIVAISVIATVGGTMLERTALGVTITTLWDGDTSITATFTAALPAAVAGGGAILRFAHDRLTRTAICGGGFSTRRTSTGRGGLGVYRRGKDGLMTRGGRFRNVRRIVTDVSRGGGGGGGTATVG